MPPARLPPRSRPRIGWRLPHRRRPPRADFCHRESVVSSVHVSRIRRTRSLLRFVGAKTVSAPCPATSEGPTCHAQRQMLMSPPPTASTNSSTLNCELRKPVMSPPQRPFWKRKRWIAAAVLWLALVSPVAYMASTGRSCGRRSRTSTGVPTAPSEVFASYRHPLLAYFFSPAEWIDRRVRPDWYSN